MRESAFGILVDVVLNEPPVNGCVTYGPQGLPHANSSRSLHHALREVRGADPLFLNEVIDYLAGIQLELPHFNHGVREPALAKNLVNFPALIVKQAQAGVHEEGHALRIGSLEHGGGDWHSRLL